MSRRRLGIVGALVGLGLSTALACGPFFPTALLDDRAGTLRATPVNSFAFEASRLVAPSDDLKAVESHESYWGQTDDHLAKERAAGEALSLTEPQVRALAAMRQAATGDAALAAAGSLPPAVGLYTAGAIEFAHDRAADAAKRFDAVLALPEPERGARAVWASYMLGRVRTLDGDLAGAATAFDQARSLARGGAPDPLGLAVASYGEQARPHVEAAKLMKAGDPAFAREITTAVALYAEQAARGSDSGVQSLRLVAELAMGADARIAAAVRDPLTQRLLVVYALARGGDPDMALSYDDAEGYELTGADGNPPKSTRLAALVGAIAATGAPPAAGADRLAALMYASGRYDLAAPLVAAATGPRALWLRAKLATRDGDLAAAAGFYADAVKALPSPGAFDDDSARLLIGETGTLALARGELIEALRLLYRAHYWSDVSHVAERVLSLDELTKFVDQTTAAEPAAPAPAAHPDPDNWWDRRAALPRLRDLLARRLARDGRFAEAARYFSDPELARQAIAYGQALDDARRRWSGIGRARAWFAAAKLARASGLELIGFEGSPDYEYWGGNLDDGIGQRKLADGPLVTPEERARFASSVAVPDRRFHYRYVAVDQALRSAALLPLRSQAFAAVLCQATGWMQETHGEDATAAALYRLYVARGPYVAWAKNFGTDCPEPDFDAAARLLWTQPLAQARHAIHARIVWIGAALIVVLALGGGWYGWRRIPA
jgi:hypothetical protein